MRARLGLLFPFLPVPGLSRHLPPSGDKAVFSHLGLLLPWIRPQLPHSGPTGPVWGFAGVVSLPRSLIHHKSPQGAESGFLPRTSSPLPLKGEGLGIIFLGFVWFTLLVHRRLTLAQQGLSLVSLVSFPYLAFKTAHRATRGLVLFHRFFLRQTRWAVCSSTMKTRRIFPTTTRSSMGITCVTVPCSPRWWNTKRRLTTLEPVPYILSKRQALVLIRG